MKKIFYLLIAFILAISINPALSQQQCTATLTNECGNCYQFTFTNNSGSPVDQIQVLVSGGSFYFSWGDVSSTAATEGWTYSPTSFNPNVTMLTFNGGTPIPNNSTKGNFHFCLSGDLQGAPIFTFRALSNKQIVCTTMTERSNMGLCCDNLVMSVVSSDATPNDQGDCCYNFTLLAKTAFTNAFYVRFRPLNDAVSVGTKIAPSSPAGWGTPSSWLNGAQFPVPASGIAPDTHQYFRLCVFMPTGVTTFPMEITYTDRQGVAICTDTIQLTCDVCAGLHIFPEPATKNANDQGDCCYTFKLIADRNYPGITHVQFTPVSYGVTIGTALPPSSPTGWGTSTPVPPNSVKFATPGIVGAGPGLPAGSHELFRLCFNFAAGVSASDIVVTFLDANNDTICLFTEFIECQAIDKCDSLKMEYEKVTPTPNDIGDCCYQFRLTTSIDFPTVQLVKFTSLSAAVLISSAQPPSSPSGWAMTPPAPPGQSVSFSAPGGYLHSGIHDSFRICYDISGSNGNFQMEVTYMSPTGATVCTDTVDIKCETSSGCDTLKMEYEKVEQTPNDQGNCCYNFKLNAGMDMPDVFYVRFKSLLAVVPIASAQPPTSPAGWGNATPTPPGQQVSFLAPSGYLHQGSHAHFRICFDMPAGTSSLPVEIAYLNRDEKEVCIDTVQVVCQTSKCNVEWRTEKVPADNKNLKGDCCYTVAMIVPTAVPGVAFVNFNPLNPGVTTATGLPAYSPPGWGAAAPSGPNGVKFHTPGTGNNLPNGVHKYFRLCYNLPAGVTTFPVEVLFTDANGQVICRDTLLMDCEKKGCEFEITGERLQVSTPATNANNLGDCCYAYKLIAHTDFPGVFYLSFTPSNPNVHITMASTPGMVPGWGSSTPNPPNGVRYLTPGLPSGAHGIPAGIHEYFRICFDLPANTFSFQMLVAMTDREGKVICVDTVDVKCGEGNGTCENLRLNSIPYNPTPNDPIRGECCQSFMFTATADFPNIYSVHFDSPSATIVGAVGPSGWVGPNPVPPANGVSWNVPTPPGMLTAGNHGPFKLCFELKAGVTTFPVIITFVDQNGNVVCKFEQMINCKDCCDRFDTIDVIQKNLRQLPLSLGRFIWLQNSLTALPGPIIRASATIVSAQIQTPTSTMALNTFSDILAAKAFMPYWVLTGWIIPCPIGGPGTSPSNGLQGVFGTFRSEPFFSREVIWGDYHHILSSVILNNANMEMLLYFPPVTSRVGDRIKFIIRYEFTDTNCCTCDKLVEYVIDRKFYGDHILTRASAQKDKNGKDVVQGQTAENDVNITMTDYQSGTLHVTNASTVSDAITITNVWLKPQYKVGINSMHDNTSGNNADTTGGIAKLNVNIAAGASTDIALVYDNILEKGLFTNTVTLKFIYDSSPLDTFTLESQVNSRVPGGGGDQLALDNSANLQNLYTYALTITNANSYEEGISSIELKTPTGADIIAVGPTIDPQQIILNAYSIQGGDNKLLPQIPASAEVSSILPGEAVKPIYISLKGTGTVNIDFITYNKNGEKMTEGSFPLVTSVVDLDDGDNQNSEFAIINCYPNPTAGNVTFQFMAKHDLNNVTLEITDLTGRVVAHVLDNNSIISGNHVVVFNTNKLSSGAYYYTLRSGNNAKSGLLNIVK